MATVEAKTSSIVVDTGIAKELDAFNVSPPIPSSNSWRVKLQAIFNKLNIEQRGIERVPEDERTDAGGIISIGTLWLATNISLSSFAMGTIGTSTFSLGFLDSVLTILFVNMLGIIPVAFWSTFGSALGLRQMVLSRYYFGFYGVKIIVIFNILGCFSWVCANTIVGAQLLTAVARDLPGYGGILILALATFLVTLFGYKIVHKYQSWSWIPTFIVFLLILGQFGASGAFRNLPVGTGRSEAAAVLSFATTLFAFSAGWTLYAADYTCYQPTTTSRGLVFISTYFGMLLPLAFTQMLGAAVMTATRATPRFAQAYADHKVGGLLGAVFSPQGPSWFGRFCMSVLALSAVASNCPDVYSLALNMQMLAGWMERVPRAAWTLLATLMYGGIAVVGYSRFESLLVMMMSAVAYGVSIYIAIALVEHLVFKKGIAGYDPLIYREPERLPPGYAAVASTAAGAAGAILGMVPFGFIGPIAKQLGEVEIGIQLAVAMTALSYLVLRTWEVRSFNR